MDGEVVGPYSLHPCVHVSPETLLSPICRGVAGIVRLWDLYHPKVVRESLLGISVIVRSEITDKGMLQGGSA